jgi:uncharacterized protein (DUF1501 family)
MMLTRRLFLHHSTLALLACGAAPRKNKVLVTIFQRGAADGLNIVIPFAEKRYYELRPSLAIPQQEVLDLNGFFGFHPALAPLLELYKSGHLAIVHAAGSPNPTRSHFDAQDFMESGTPGRKSTRDGWLNRALPAGPPTPLRAVSLGPLLPRALRGPHPAVAIDDLQNFRLRDQRAAAAFQSAYSQDPLLRSPARDTFDAMKLLESLPAHSPPAPYPRSRFGRSLEQLARLIKSDVGLQAAFTDVGGWDHHVNEAPQLNALLRDFAQALHAFWRDLGDRLDEVVVVTLSEFGRTAGENGNRGTDHGHAGVMFVYGGPVRGGKIYGEWPGLEPEQLYERRDLALTTDFRDVLGELVARHLGNSRLDAVFPFYSARRFPNLLAG